MPLVQIQYRPFINQGFLNLSAFPYLRNGQGVDGKLVQEYVQKPYKNSDQV